MNLWILSQDGKHFFQNPNLSVETTNDCGYIVDNSTQTILGKYESEERAKEVILDIKNFLIYKLSFEGNAQECDLFVKSKILGQMVKVYELPEK